MISNRTDAKKSLEQKKSLNDKQKKSKTISKANIKQRFKDFIQIGVGSTSIVYSVKDFVNVDNEDNPKYALKCIKKSHPNAKTLFTNEIKILQQLNNRNSLHPNIVKIFEEIEDQLYFCIKTELLSGPELFETIEQHYQNHKPKPYENSYVIECAKQLLNAIDYMHNVHQIVHRDIKPSNIKFRKAYQINDLRENFELVFIDFAFSKLIQLEEIYENVETVGTLEYLAPEILLQKELSGKQILSSDMYSLGSLLYGLMTGRLPISGTTIGELKRNKRKGKIRWNIPNCCEDAIDLLQKMMEKNCDKRISAKEALLHPWLNVVEDDGRSIHSNSSSSNSILLN